MKNLLVYVVSISEHLAFLEENDLHGKDAHELSDADFAKESVRQQNVFSLGDFADQFNNGNVAPGDCYIRILDASIEHEQFEKECDDLEKELWNSPTGTPEV